MAANAHAGSVLANRPIPAFSVIQPSDVSQSEIEIAGAVPSIEDALGLETSVTLYPGRAIMIGDLGPPAIVGRNEIIRLVFRRGPLSILTEGRALDRGAIGDRIRIMNLDSRAIVVGVLNADKTAEVTR